MDDYITAYEYEKNVNPKLTHIPLNNNNVQDCDYGINFLDFSDLYNVEYECTTPNLLAGFIKIQKYDNNLVILSNNLISKNEYNVFNATSNLFFVLQGSCDIFIDTVKYTVSEGDILITPVFGSLFIQREGDEDLNIYYVNDSPLVNYLGCMPKRKIFKTAIYSKEFLMTNLQNLSDPNNNRKGILLSNKDTERIGTNTITPVLWSLYNELPPNTVQRPHKHNSVAIDLCISCEDSENIYTLIGKNLDENGNIINPVKVHWKRGEMFITPPGLWHSHNNTGNTFAYILPIQDAGLLLYQRILGIVLN
jgi:gentisate 1,2-dioxygenase